MRVSQKNYILHGSIDPAINNHYIWEMILVRDYDMVVSLVGSYGAIDELSLFSSAELARKAALFFNQDHATGLAFEHAKMIEAIGAKLHTFDYPADLTTCNLMKRVRRRRFGQSVSAGFWPLELAMSTDVIQNTNRLIADTEPIRRFVDQADIERVRSETRSLAKERNFTMRARVA